LEIEMTQGANSKGKAEALKDTAENKVSQISTTSDELSDSSLDSVAGGLLFTNQLPRPPVKNPFG
jgi:hypothetical protein